MRKKTEVYLAISIMGIALAAMFFTGLFERFSKWCNVLHRSRTVLL